MSLIALGNLTQLSRRTCCPTWTSKATDKQRQSAPAGTFWCGGLECQSLSKLSINTFSSFALRRCF